MTCILAADDKLCQATSVGLCVLDSMLGATFSPDAQTG